MASSSLFHYLRKAFTWRPQIPGLGKVPLNYLMLGAATFFGAVVNPGFWLLGLGAEAFYLWLVATHPRFQALVDRQQRDVKREGGRQRVEKAKAQLTRRSRERYERLDQQAREALRMARRVDEQDLGQTLALRTKGLTQLLWLFLKLLTSRDALEQSVSRIHRDGLEQEIEQLQERVEEEEEGSTLHRSLEGTLEIQNRRLANYEEAVESLEVIDAELERIEQKVVLIREEAATVRRPEEISDRLDSVTAALTETNRWMDQNAALFAGLGADNLGDAPVEVLAESEGAGAANSGGRR
ncbi:MAG: hypothetical protein AAGD01_07635 [Acidobacteriota bacterium]